MMTTKQTVYQKSTDNFLFEETTNLPRGCFGTRQQERGASHFRHIIKRSRFSLIMAGLLVGCVSIAPTFGVEVEDLKAPIKDLKETIFGGWMWVPKIGAAVGGCLLAVYNQSIMPLATGAGIGLGIHFYDLYIKAEGALI